MATSGTKTFDLNLNQLIEEAYERVGLVPRSGADYRSARRSLDLLFIEFSNRGTNFWKLVDDTTTTTAGVGTVALTTNVQDVLDLAVRTGSGTSQQDTEVTRIGRDEWFDIPNKLVQGKPTRFWLDRQRDSVTLNLWPVPDQAYTLAYQTLDQFEDAGSPATNTVDSPWRFLPAVVAGLAWKIAQKRSPERAQLLKAIFEEEWSLAQSADRERVPLRMRPNLRAYMR